MADLGVIVTGDREIEDRFDAASPQLLNALEERINALTDELYGLVEAAVPRRTGRLASEIVKSVRRTESAVIGKVSVAAPKGSSEFGKAGTLEYGGTGERFAVRAHEARLDHLWGRILGAPLMVSVAAHDRFTLIPAHRFMRGPLEEMRGEIVQDLQQTVSETLQP